MAARLITAALGIPLALWFVYVGGWWLLLALFFILAQAGNEWLQLLAGQTGHKFEGIAVPAAVGLFFILAGVAQGGFTWGLVGLVGALLLASFSVLRAAAGPDANLPLATSWQWLTGIWFGFFIVGWSGSLLFLLRQHAGSAWVFMTLFSIWAADTAAYFIGTRWGRRRLAPAISPNKSWEGLWAGTVASLLVGTVGAAIGTVTYPVGLSIGLIAAIGGVMGDLVESLLKRSAGSKDSGTLLPGHGGFLDRLDGLLFSMPAVYSLYLLLGA